MRFIVAMIVSLVMYYVIMRIAIIRNKGTI